MSGFYDDEEASPWASQVDDGLHDTFNASSEASPWAQPNDPLADSEASPYDPYYGSAPLVDKESDEETRNDEIEAEESTEKPEKVEETVKEAEAPQELKSVRKRASKKTRGALKVERVEEDPLAASQLIDVNLGVASSGNAGANASAGLETSAPSALATNEPLDATNTSIGAAPSVSSFGTPQPVAKPRVAARFDINVGDAATVGDMTNAHTEYTVQLSTDCTDYDPQETAVQRRYRDFRWLYRTLEKTHPGVIVPAVPGKQALGRFNEDFVAQRRAGLETMLRKMVAHPLLYRDADLIAFLTSPDFGEHLRTRLVDEETMQKLARDDDSVSGLSQSGSGGSGLIGTLSGALSLSRGPESDPWTVEKRRRLDEVEAHLRAISRDLVAISIDRQRLSDSLGDLANVIKVLSEIEATQRLSAVLRNFSKVHARLAAIYARQRQQNLLTLETALDEHTRTITSVRDALVARQHIFSEAEAATAEYERRAAALGKLRGQGRVQSDRDRALEEDAETAGERAQQLQKKARDVAHLVESELQRVNDEKVAEFRNAVEIYLEVTVEAQKEAIEVWETFYSRNFGGESRAVQ